MQLRPYQEMARQAVQAEWGQGNKKTLLVLPTGTGKTVVFSKIIQDQVERGKRALVLAHRGELLDQAADKLSKVTGLQSAVEKAGDTAAGSLFPVTVGSVQTLSRDKRLEAFSPSYFDTIVIDEAHHALSDSYIKVLDYFHDADVLGVTATPDRGDRRNLGKVFDSLAYEYTLPKAIKEGFLSPIRALTIPIDLDLENVSQQAGDFKAAEVGHAIEPYLEAIADEMAKVCMERKTVVFLPLIATSQKFRDILETRGFRAAEVNGNSPDRAEILADFEAGKYNVLCNSMLLTEGWDCPSVDCVVVLRPTKVRALYSQMVGRGTRLHPGKSDLLILDFLWHTSRHELIRPAHLIATDSVHAQKMTERIHEAGQLGMDLEEAESIAKEDVIADRERALAEKLAEQRRKKKAFVDPLQYAMSIAADDLVDYIPQFPWEQGPPSEKVLQALEKRGINADEIQNAGMAKLIMDKLILRQQEGLATPKQIRLLERYGFRRVGDWQFDAASKMIGRISANKWKVPQGIRPWEYKPQKAQEYTWNSSI